MPGQPACRRTDHLYTGKYSLLVLMGIGRAKMGKRPMGRSVLETIAIATAGRDYRCHCGLLLN
ncbi:MAG: hypothetical protein ABFC24_04525 [Methanoregulaceae archaeon]